MAQSQVPYCKEKPRTYKTGPRYTGCYREFVRTGPRNTGCRGEFIRQPMDPMAA